MSKITSQQLRELYKKLPEDLKDAISSSDSANTIQIIGKKYSLGIDKVGELADEVGLVMLGLTAPKDFIPNLAKRIGGDKENLRKIAEEVNTQIFKRVRGSLKEIHQMGSATADLQPAAADLRPVKPTPAQPVKEEASDEMNNEATKDEKKEEDAIPKIFEGNSTPEPISGSDAEPLPGPFEAKTGEGVFRMPAEESKQEEPEKNPEMPYSGDDPYREPIE